MLGEIESDGYQVHGRAKISGEGEGVWKNEGNVPNGTGVSLSRLPTSCPKAREVKEDKVKAKNNAWKVMKSEGSRKVWFGKFIAPMLAISGGKFSSIFPRRV